LGEQNAGSVADRDHSNWYRELFGPSVTAGILRPADLAGYRDAPVYIRRSMHTPPDIEAVRELMPALFELLEQEAEASVRVVLGHFMFVYIHPYMDDNGLNLLPATEPGFTASEDFSEFVDAGVPSLFFGIGGDDSAMLADYKAQAKPVPVNHSPYFAPVPEPTIRTGVMVLTPAVLMVTS